MKQILRYLVTLARELADENAYERHLKVTGRSHSPAEWRSFIDGKHARKFRNAKCC